MIPVFICGIIWLLRHWWQVTRQTCRHRHPHHPHRIPPPGYLKLPAALPPAWSDDLSDSCAGSCRAFADHSAIVMEPRACFLMSFGIQSLPLIDFGYISVIALKSPIDCLTWRKWVSLAARDTQTSLFPLDPQCCFPGLISCSGSVPLCTLCTRGSLWLRAVFTGSRGLSGQWPRLFYWPHRDPAGVQGDPSLFYVMSISSQAAQFCLMSLDVHVGSIWLCSVILFISFVNILSSALQMCSLGPQDRPC